MTNEQRARNIRNYQQSICGSGQGAMPETSAPAAYVYEIDGYPVSKKEALDHATIIAGHVVKSISSAKRILSDDGRELVEIPA